MDQSELDALLNELKPDQGGELSAAKADDEITWDDVKEDLDKSKSALPKTEVSQVQFDEIPRGTPAKSNLDLDFILDIPLTVSVELGRCRMLINELLQLGQGSVIEMTKLAGEPMDIYINQKLIARGEVVVVNEKFGIRLTDIVSPAERVSKLR